MTTIATGERYAGGYGPLSVEGLSHRKLARDGAFFLPHLTPEMKILDCGCGPGALSLELAGVASRGEVVGIDIEPGLLRLGRERARELGRQNVRFECGDLYALPFEDEAFDAVFAHAVVYHLGRPLEALGEIHRVLKPGGVLALRDADMGGDVYAPASPLLDQAWSLVARVFERSGATLHFGRTQRAALRRVGFARTQASASYDCVGTLEGTVWFSAYWTHFLGELHAELILTQGWSTRAELDQVLSALRAWAVHPDAFYARCRCEALAWKAVREQAGD